MQRFRNIALCAAFLVLGWQPGYGATDASVAEGARYPDAMSTTILTYTLEKTARRYADVMGVSDWKVTTEHGELTTWKGQVSTKQQVVFARAVGRLGGVQLELLQPSANADLFRQFLKDTGGTAAYDFSFGDGPVKDRILADLKSGRMRRSMTLRTDSGAVVTWVDTQDMLGVPVSVEEQRGTLAGPARTLHLDGKGVPHAATTAITHMCIVVRESARVTPGWEKLFDTKFGAIDLPISEQAQIVVRDQPVNTSGFGENVLKGAPGAVGPMSPVGPLGHGGPVQIEILEPVWGDDAPSLFLRERGEGIQHIGVDMDGNIADTEAAFRSAGYIVDMTGVLFHKFKFLMIYTRDLGADLEFLGPAPGTAP